MASLYCNRYESVIIMDTYYLFHDWNDSVLVLVVYVKTDS